MTSLTAPKSVKAAEVTVSNLALATGSADAGNKATLNLTGTDASTETITPANLTVKVFSGASDVTSKFKVTYGTFVPGDGSSTKATLPINITLPRTAKTTDSYTVSVTHNNGTPDNKADDKTVTNSLTVSADYATPNVTAPDDASGIVHTAISIADGKSYKLVDDTAKFTVAWEDGNRTYRADELSWVFVGSDVKSANSTGETPSDTSQPQLDGGSFSGRTLTVTNATKLATLTSPTLIGYTHVGSTNKVVYANNITLTAAIQTYTDAVSASTSVKTFKAAGSESKNVISSTLFDGIRFQKNANNEYVAGSDFNANAVTATVSGDTTYFEVAKDGVDSTTKVTGDIKSDIKTGDYPLQGFVLRGVAGQTVIRGTYHLALSLKYSVVTGQTLEKVINITITVGTGPTVTCKDGNVIYATNGTGITLADDPTIYLDLKTNKTYDLASKLVSDTPNTTYSYKLSSSNVSVSAAGVVTANTVGTAIVTVTPKADGVEGGELKVNFRVNSTSFDSLTVKGNDNDTADVLDYKTYTNNTVDKERNLAVRQIKYVQIEVTGNETSNITETPVVTSANKANLTYSLAAKPDGSNADIDANTGKITIPYTQVKKAPNNKAFGVYAVKVISAATATSEQTTSYYYVVVDYPDKAITGVQDQYTVGVCTDPTHSAKEATPAIEFGPESGYTVTKMDVIDKDTDSFVGKDTYANDDVNKFLNRKDNLSIDRATADGQTEHVLVYNEADGNHGNTYKVVTIKSAPANDNYVTKIVNKDTGDVIFDAEKDSKETAKKITISDTTNISVTLHTPVANTGSAVTLSISDVNSKSGSVINQNIYVTAVKSTNNIDVVLYPNSVGTQVISIAPAGHNTLTDRTDIHHNPTLLAVDYRGASAKKPVKVTGLKVKNKKGAKVSVTWDAQDSTILYRVYKKVGNGSWKAKNVTDPKATLQVKKGAKVTVKVKAFRRDENGKAVWQSGKATKAKTFKTDKK